MNTDIRPYVCGIALVLASASASAVPITASGSSGLPGTSAAVTLSDGLTNALDSLSVLIEFDATRLAYGLTVAGTLFPNGTVHTEIPIGSNRVILGVSSSGAASNGESGSLIAVNLDILAGALAGLAEVNFRCMPLDDQKPVDTVTRQTSPSELNELCADYAVPFTASGIEVLAAPTAQAPVSSTASLALLGLGIMGLVMRRMRLR